MDVGSFSPAQATAWMPEVEQRRSSCRMCCRKAQPRLTDLPGMDARQAPSGVASLWATFLSQTQTEKGGSRSAAVRKLLLCSRESKSERRWTPAFAGATARWVHRKHLPLTPTISPRGGEGAKKIRCKRRSPPNGGLPHINTLRKPITPATPDSSAARMPPDPATARLRKSPPAPAARSPDHAPCPHQPHSRRA